MKIGQISFFRMTTPADHPYGSDATVEKGVDHGFRSRVNRKS